MIRTLARVFFGFVLACITAGLVMVLFVTTPSELLSTNADAFPERATQTLIWGLLTATHSALFAAAFVLIATGIAEYMSLRSLPYYLAAGMVISSLGFIAQYSSEVIGQPTVLNNYALKAFLTAGFFAGLVYWMLAGRFAGVAADNEGGKRSSFPAPPVPPRIVVKDPSRGVSTGAAETSGGTRSRMSKTVAAAQISDDGDADRAAARRLKTH